MSPKQALAIKADSPKQTEAQGWVRSLLSSSSEPSICKRSNRSLPHSLPPLWGGLTGILGPCHPLCDASPPPRSPGTRSSAGTGVLGSRVQAAPSPAQHKPPCSPQHPALPGGSGFPGGVFGHRGSAGAITRGEEEQAARSRGETALQSRARPCRRRGADYSSQQAALFRAASGRGTPGRAAPRWSPARGNWNSSPGWSGPGCVAVGEERGPWHPDSSKATQKDVGSSPSPLALARVLEGQCLALGVSPCLRGC